MVRRPTANDGNFLKKAASYLRRSKNGKPLADSGDPQLIRMRKLDEPNAPFYDIPGRSDYYDDNPTYNDDKWNNVNKGK
jgi:hypothetical protein